MQEIAFVDTQTGEYDERQLDHSGAVLLADACARSSNPSPIRSDSSADLGAAGPNRLKARQTKRPGKEGLWVWSGVREMPRNGSFSPLHIDTSRLKGPRMEADATRNNLVHL